MGFPVIFPTPMNLNFHRFVILYSCDKEVWDLDNTVYRKCIMALTLYLFCLLVCIFGFDFWG